MSNNGSDWLRLERYAKGLLESNRDVYIISGPLFLVESAAGKGGAAALAAPAGCGRASEVALERGAASDTVPPPPPEPVTSRVSYPVIGPHQVAVPTHLFKVVLAEGPDDDRRALSAFVLPNGPLPGHPDLERFVVPIEVSPHVRQCQRRAEIGSELAAGQPAIGQSPAGPARSPSPALSPHGLKTSH